MKKSIASSVILSMLILSGCATTSGLAPKVSQSGFDGSKRVEIMPHGTQCKDFSKPCLNVGAVWGSKTNTTALIVQMQEIIGISGASLNIDGDVVDLGKPIGLTDIDTSMPVLSISQNRFIVPNDTVDRILNSKRTWIRLDTTKGIVEDAIIDEKGDSKSFHALKRFSDQVKATK